VVGVGCSSWEFGLTEQAPVVKYERQDELT